MFNPRRVILDQGLIGCKVEPIVFQMATYIATIILVVYVNDILIARSHTVGLAHIKSFLWMHMIIHDWVPK